MSLPNAPDVSPLYTLFVFHSSLTLNDKQLSVWQREKTVLYYTLIMSKNTNTLFKEIYFIHVLLFNVPGTVSITNARHKNLIAISGMDCMLS